MLLFYDVYLHCLFMKFRMALFLSQGQYCLLLFLTCYTAFFLIILNVTVFFIISVFTGRWNYSFLIDSLMTCNNYDKLGGRRGMKDMVRELKGEEKEEEVEEKGEE